MIKIDDDIWLVKTRGLGVIKRRTNQFRFPNIGVHFFAIYFISLTSNEMTKKNVSRRNACSVQCRCNRVLHARNAQLGTF